MVSDNQFQQEKLLYHAVTLQCVFTIIGNGGNRNGITVRKTNQR